MSDCGDASKVTGPRERVRIRQSTTARIHFVRAGSVGDISIFFTHMREDLIQRACCEEDRPKVDTESHVLGRRDPTIKREKEEEEEEKKKENKRQRAAKK